ncbi:unnamed protein product [Linum trigynum]|uniref:Uncharacterized protein n=1 Tax=Linum trigynum TaxID=586398 RepID=A0AAV2FJR6_9ROSI
MYGDGYYPWVPETHGYGDGFAKHSPAWVWGGYGFEYLKMGMGWFRQTRPIAIPSWKHELAYPKARMPNLS